MNVATPYSDYLKDQFDDNLNKKRQKTSSLMEEVQKSAADDTAIIESYLTQKDVAPWFRGTSIFHMQGANMLLNALRDDAEQRTTHRVRSCLNLIGLEPMITSKEIVLLMRLSRGNDLAFLWFLMEKHYKTTKPGSYTVNEQLICSAICHLDTITTLRELDKILPRGHTSGIEAGKAGAKCKTFKNYYGQANKKRSKPKYVLPYFEKNCRPKPYGKSLTLKVPNFKVDFDIYKAYSDCNHIVSNESNRWYANYDLNPGRRIAFRIIRDTVGYVFEHFEAESLKANTVDKLCSYHKTIKEMEENLEHELRVTTRDKCLKTYFGTAEVKEKHTKYIKDLLDKAIEQQLCKFRKQANTLRKEMTLINITSDCDIYDVMLGGDLNECCKVIPGVPGELVKKKENDPAKMNDNNCDVSKNVLPNSGEYRKSITELLINIGQTSKIALDTSEFSERYIGNYDYGHVGETPTPSQNVFHAPMQQKPHKFDYRKILMQKSNYDGMRQIKEALLRALDINTSTLAEFREDELNFDKFVRESVNNAFINALKKYEEENEAKIGEQMAERARPLRQYPNLVNYNCEDRDLIDQMLFDAFKYLRKNPKFVWAQLPDAHKIPMLREWIAQRFGKEYTPMERANAYRLSCKIFHALDKTNFGFPMPNANQVAKNQFVNYNCHHYLNKKCKHIKDKYYRRLDAALMEQTRIFWFAMRAYVCSNGPPRKTFFAYMPSRFRDIQHFRLWKSYEYRNYKDAWDARQRAKRRQQFYC